MNISSQLFLFLTLYALILVANYFKLIIANYFQTSKRAGVPDSLDDEPSANEIEQDLADIAAMEQ